jgi:hypothetical protein
MRRTEKTEQTANQTRPDRIFAKKFHSIALAISGSDNIPGFLSKLTGARLTTFRHPFVRVAVALTYCAPSWPPSQYEQRH